MPRLKTRKAPPAAQKDATEPERLAVGLHYSERSQRYFFDDFRGRSAVKKLWSIGRGVNCELRLKDLYVSHVHAIVQRRRDGAALLYDHDSTNGVYVNGRRIDEPVLLTVGMHILIGRTLLIAVDARGSFPIAASSIREFCRKAAELYGNNTIAGEHVGRSREYVRRLRDASNEVT